MVKLNSQFIIATHSPITMAYPHAKIYLFSEGDLREVAYEETEHYRVAKDILDRRE
jgi:predicted ATPase